MAKKDTDDITNFEDGLSRLEAIVEDMESGDLPLDQLIKDYEQGSQLLKSCQNKLKEAEKKIEILRAKNASNPEFEDFDPDSDS